jgi:ribonucleotide reductase beta subunit family protein with ferritin-like domain
MYTVFSIGHAGAPAETYLSDLGHDVSTERVETMDDLRARVRPFVRDPSECTIVRDDGTVYYSLEQVRDSLEEPILTSTKKAVFPVEYGDIYALYKKAVAAFWTSDEIMLSDDARAYETLSEDEKILLRRVLGFFSQADSLVLENIHINFGEEVSIPESRLFLSNQVFMESEHAIVYSALIDALISDPGERSMMLDSIKHIPSVREKAEWAHQWMNQRQRFATRLLGFACVEGILFSSSFASIFWLKTRQNIPGLNLSNQFISRDEAMHVDHAVALYNHLLYKLPETEVHSIIKGAVDAEKTFVDDAIPRTLIGMNKDLMKQYVEFVADTLAKDLGYTPIYGSENPFTFMENLGLQGKTNFFEHRPSDYARARYDDSDESSSDADDF